MKKLVVIVLVLAGLTTFAQGKKEGEMSKPEGEKMSVEQKVAHKVDRMKKDLNLTDKQVAEVKILVEKEFARKEENRKKMKAIREEMRPTKEEREAMKTEMNRILTPEQLKKLEAQHKERKEELREERKDRKINK